MATLEMTDTKVCKVCHNPKALDCYEKQSDGVQGVRNTCKACRYEKRGRRATGAAQSEGEGVQIIVMEQVIKADMTSAEVDVFASRFNSNKATMRADLLEMFERNAHKAKRFADFVSFAEMVLEINLSDRTIERMLAQERVLRALAPVLGRLPSPNLKQSLALNRLISTPDLLIQSWEEMQTLNEMSTRNPVQLATELDRLTKQKQQANILPTVTVTVGPTSESEKDFFQSPPPPTPVPTATPQKSTVSSFSAPADVAPAVGEESGILIDFKDAKEAICIALAWIEAEEVTDDRATVDWTAEQLEALGKWAARARR